MNPLATSEHAPYYFQKFKTNLYVAQSGKADKGWCGYILRADESQKTDKISLTDAFSKYHGTYLFASIAPRLDSILEIENFVSKVRKFLDDEYQPAPFRGRAFIWLHNPAAESYKKSNLSSFNFAKLPDGIYFSSDFNAACNLTAIGFTMTKQCYIKLSDTGFVFGAESAGNIRLTTQPVGNHTDISPYKVELPLFGPQRGCLKYSIYFQQSFDFDFFKTGLCYFHPSSERPGSYDIQYYPVFNSRNQNHSVGFAASFDPTDNLNHHNSLRSYFMFTGKNLDGSDTLLPSYFRTVCGHAIDLVPAFLHSDPKEDMPNEHSPRLVLEDKRDPTGKFYDGFGYYLTPGGDFHLQVDGVDVNAAPVMHNFLCGFLGTEVISFLPPGNNGNGDRLRFDPGRNAFAPLFPYEKTSPAVIPTAENPPRLDNTRTTSWVTIVPGDTGANQYYSQPDQAPLFSRLANGSDDSRPLEFLEIPAADLSFAGAEPPFFPMVPYAGLKNRDLTFYRRFEQEIIYPCRCRVIFTHTADPKPVARALLPAIDKKEGPEPPRGTTPQGLLAIFKSYDSKIVWDRIVFARDNKDNQLSFAGVGHPPGSPPTSLERAFQSNQMFLVISDPAAISDFCPKPESNYPEPNIIEMEDWKFHLDPAGEKGRKSAWANHGTILLFKFFDKSLEDLVQDSSLWTQGTHFNKDISDVQNRLKKIQNDIPGQDKAGTYTYLQDVIFKNPKWQGIIAFNVTVLSADLPEQLAGLAAGIKPQNFYAHHVGVNLSPAQQINGKLEMGRSALFGLVDYRDDSAMKLQGDYGFKVKSFQVLFHNSTIIRFTSKIELAIKSLFGEKVYLQRSEDAAKEDLINHIITLDGTFQSSSDQPINGSGLNNNRFAYTLSQEGQHIFKIQARNGQEDKKILKTVSILKAGFFPTAPNAKEAGDSTVRTRFSFCGKLNFNILRYTGQTGEKDFDVFSFGSEPQSDTSVENPEGLSFSDLGLEMIFPKDNPTAAEFRFEPGRMSFDPADSSYRKKSSLYAHFPLKLTGFQSSANHKSPRDLGYGSVDTPLINSALDKTWYGLEYELKLGSLGDLAGKAGLVVNLLVAWSPADAGLPVYIGIRLPFGSGGTIGIEGVLALKVKRFQLLADESSGGFMLRFNQISLDFLKKSLPPGGTTSLFIFGDPREDGRNDTLGWYGAYAKKRPPPKKKE